MRPNEIPVGDPNAVTDGVGWVLMGSIKEGMPAGVQSALLRAVMAIHGCGMVDGPGLDRWAQAAPHLDEAYRLVLTTGRLDWCEWVGGVSWHVGQMRGRLSEPDLGMRSVVGLQDLP